VPHNIHTELFKVTELQFLNELFSRNFIGQWSP